MQTVVKQTFVFVHRAQFPNLRDVSFFKFKRQIDLFVLGQR